MYIGKLARIIFGTGAGQPPFVVQANGSDTIVIGPPAPAVIPDSTSVITLEDFDWGPSASTIPYKASNWNGVSHIIGSLVVPNKTGVMLVQVVTVGADGTQWSPDEFSAFREIYVVGFTSGMGLSAFW